MAIDRKCPSCGGTLFFDPGWDRLICKSCGYKETIPELVSKIPVPEQDFVTAQTHASHDWGMQTQVFQCAQCAGEFINNKLLLSGSCPFCGSTKIVPAATSGEPLLAPNGIIPFKVREIQAKNTLIRWLGERRAAPDQLKQNANLHEFTGIYIPYFTFDFDSANQYRGKFGYVSSVKDGNSCISWYEKTGTFNKFIDDFPVVASNVIATDALLVSVMKYRTREARPYTPDALAGFPAEHYSVGLAEAWGRAMNDVVYYLKKEAESIESASKEKIDVYSTFSNIKYKYLLVPVWISSFTYNNKLYKIVVNGQTGEIKGQWPASFGGFVRDLFGGKFN